MEKKKFKLGLVPKLIIAIIIGILFGQFLPTGFCRFVVTLSGFFSTYLKFIIPLMILAYVTMGIADLSQGAGQLLLITVALAYGSTLLAGKASYFEDYRSDILERHYIMYFIMKMMEKEKLQVLVHYVRHFQQRSELVIS